VARLDPVYGYASPSPVFCAPFLTRSGYPPPCKDVCCPTTWWGGGRTSAGRSPQAGRTRRHVVANPGQEEAVAVLPGGDAPRAPVRGHASRPLALPDRAVGLEGRSRDDREAAGHGGSRPTLREGPHRLAREAPRLGCAARWCATQDDRDPVPRRRNPRLASGGTPPVVRRAGPLAGDRSAGWSGCARPTRCRGRRGAPITASTSWSGPTACRTYARRRRERGRRRGTASTCTVRQPFVGLAAGAGGVGSRLAWRWAAARAALASAFAFTSAAALAPRLGLPGECRGAEGRPSCPESLKLRALLAPR